MYAKMETTGGGEATSTFFPVFKEALYLNLGKVAAERSDVAAFAAKAATAGVAGAAGVAGGGRRVDAGTVDMWFAEAFVLTVSENDEHLTLHDMLELAHLPVDLQRVHGHAVYHNLDHLRFVDDLHRVRKRGLLLDEGEENEDEEGLEDDDEGDESGTENSRRRRRRRGGGGAFHKMTHMVEHFAQAVKECGNRLDAGVLGAFKRKLEQKRGRKRVGKRRLACLIAMHVPAKSTRRQKQERATVLR